MAPIVSEAKAFDLPVASTSPLPPSHTPTKLAPTGEGNPDVLTPSNSRLTEISNQLRVYQAESRAQLLEIDRLQRQLKILADLQGVSVADLHAALNQACHDEAHEEWQRRVDVLRAQLEAEIFKKKGSHAQDILQLQTKVQELEVDRDRQSGENKKLKEELKKALKRASVNEEEEVRVAHAKQVEKIKSMHEQQRNAWICMMDSLKKEHFAEVESIKTMNENVLGLQKMLIEEKDQEIQGVRSDNTKKATLLEESVIQIRDLQGQIAQLNQEHKLLINQQQQQQLGSSLEEDDEDDDKDAVLAVQADQLDTMQEALNQSEEDMLLWRERYDESQKQVSLLQQTMKEREVEFKAKSIRFDEKMKDLNQQFSSLYTACGMMREEQQEVIQDGQSLRSMLHQADEEVARRDNTDLSVQSPSSRPSLAAPVSIERETVLISGSLYQEILSGTPLKKGGFLRGGRNGNKTRFPMEWRKRPASLTASLTHILFTIGSQSDGGAIRYVLNFGVTKVTLLPSRVFGMRVDISPGTDVVLNIAAEDDSDFNRWWEALQNATTGSTTTASDNSDNGGIQEASLRPGVLA